MFSAIILSAGRSTRFEAPKALAQITESQTVIQRIKNTLLSSEIFEIIVVTGVHDQEIKSHLLNHTKVKIVYNKDHNFGQTSSFKTGIQAMSGDSKGCFLWPVDYPLILRTTINQLLTEFSKTNPLILIPTFNDRKGHPPLFSTNVLERILQLDNQLGINSIFQSLGDELKTLAVEDNGVVQSFNDKWEFEQLKAALKD